jgi:AcrR family transcriptional regulator
MDDLRPERSAARAPTQLRGQARFEIVLDAARQLLGEQGFAGFSIPALAEHLGFTRASIYNFFPTPYAILNELARRELQALEAHLVRRMARLKPSAWRDRIRLTVGEAARFYNQNPVARLLVLGGSLTDEGYRAQAVTIQHLGGLSQRMFADAGIALRREPVDVMVLAVELGVACFRHSVFAHGRITPAYEAEAAEVMTRYLEPYVQSELGARRA